MLDGKEVVIADYEVLIRKHNLVFMPTIVVVDDGLTVVDIQCGASAFFCRRLVEFLTGKDDWS